jgi:hypothetical protein
VGCGVSGWNREEVVRWWRGGEQRADADADENADDASSRIS